MKQSLKSKATQNLIINKSFEMFYSNGFKSTNIPDIMRETSLSKGAFYHHFKNKHEIGIKVIENIITKRIQDGFIVPLEDYKNKNIPKLLLYIFTERIKKFSEKEKELGCPANNLINEIGCSDSEFRILLRNLIDSWQIALVKVLEFGKAKNQIHSNVNCSALATCLIGSFEGIRGIRKIYDNNQIFDNYIIGITHYINAIKKK